MDLTLDHRRLGQVGRWLALFLLVAQFGAEIHFYSHPLAEPTDRLGAARSCGACLASSQLQHAVAAPAPAVPVRTVAWVASVPEASVPATHTAPFRAFRSRAPPALA
ncbi:MAG: hypothetical protein FJ171_11570 [Gammaproteobacteria bacterium]|nr:hypothetical protein [Gammaproteobacteria bacterium]